MKPDGGKLKNGGPATTLPNHWGVADPPIEPFRIEAKTTELLARITHDPNTMGGRPCIRGMRVTVGTIVGSLATGRSIEEVLQAYPHLEREDVLDALAYATWRLQEMDLPLNAS